MKHIARNIRFSFPSVRCSIEIDWFVASYKYFIFHATCFKQFVSLACAAPYAWFTFLSRQQETRWERDCEGYLRLVFHTLKQFSSHLEALGDMLVNQSQVKRNENVSNVLPIAVGLLVHWGDVVQSFMFIKMN